MINFYMKCCIIFRSDKLNKENAQENKEEISSMIKYYPFTTIVCYMPLTILRILQSIDEYIPD